MALAAIVGVFSPAGLLAWFIALGGPHVPTSPF